MPARLDVISGQRKWAKLSQLTHDDHGYLVNLADNLQRPLSACAIRGFGQGSGSELKDSLDRPAKMKALHSSAALVVNVFDHWTDHDASPLASALGQMGEVKRIEFEAQFPTGLGGNPPNLDVVLQFASNTTVAIESKFTEWMVPKSGNKEHFRPAYFSESQGAWGQIGLPNCQSLAEGIKTGTERFRYFDAPQLLKHALGLATGLSGRFSLHYLYYDSPGPESEVHSAEIKRFLDWLDGEIPFVHLKYQDVFRHLNKVAGNEYQRYLEYLRTRYFSP